MPTGIRGSLVLGLLVLLGLLASPASTPAVAPPPFGRIVVGGWSDVVGLSSLSEVPRGAIGPRMTPASMRTSIVRMFALLGCEAMSIWSAAVFAALQMKRATRLVGLPPDTIRAGQDRGSVRARPGSLRDLSLQWRVGCCKEGGEHGISRDEIGHRACQTALR